MNERIKILRNKLNLTQDEFAKQLGMNRGTLAGYETSIQPSRSFIILLCREFNVNEEWILTGKGNMFLQLSLDDELNNFFKDLELNANDSFKKEFITMLSQLDENEWDLLAKMAQKIIDERITITINMITLAAAALL